MNRLRQIRNCGQQIWLDALSREMWTSGRLARWIEEDGLAGVTTNPVLFNQALQQDPSYRSEHSRINTHTAEACYEALVLPDICAACELLSPLYQSTSAEMGYVSFEVAPKHANDAKATVREAQRLWAAIDRPNAMIKIPATPAGIDAISEALADGINVNATLIFSHRQAHAVGDAYIKGISARLDNGKSVEPVRMVVSIFISRIDTVVDDLLPPEYAMARGVTAIASAKILYRDWQQRFNLATEFQRLSASGVKPPQLLWASTGTKNPAYSDVLYLESLIGPHTVNTVPLATMEAFRDHGVAVETLSKGLHEAATWLETLTGEQLADLNKIGERLQEAGLAQFESAFASMLETFEAPTEVA